MAAGSGSEKFTFFWRTESPFSQFHPSKFHGKPLFKITDEDEEGYEFLHCEQWMMFNKAKLFNDEESAKKILATSKPPSCKALGRKVKNFTESVWIGHNQKIIMEGNRLKFTQNPHLFKQLMDTDGTTLVEASPTDRIYGIGLDASHPHAQNRATWRGKNLLGQTLTTLREELKLKESSDSDQ